MSTAWTVIIICIIVTVCYGVAYGWAIGAWNPARQIKLLSMRRHRRHCYNCRNMGYENECYAYKGRVKYDYVTGSRVMIGADKVRHIQDNIGTRHCKWKPVPNSEFVFDPNKATIEEVTKILHELDD